MADHRLDDDNVPVDRRQETVVTEEPGYESVRHVTYDSAAEQRQRTNQFASLIWLLVGVLEALLGLRFLLRLIGANAGSAFTSLIYQVTDPFVNFFSGVVGTPQAAGAAFEVTTLLAMLVYALVGWLLVRLVEVLSQRPSARTVSHSVREDDVRRHDDRLD